MGRQCVIKPTDGGLLREYVLTMGVARGLSEFNVLCDKVRANVASYVRPGVVYSDKQKKAANDKIRAFNARGIVHDHYFTWEPVGTGYYSTLHIKFKPLGIMTGANQWTSGYINEDGDFMPRYQYSSQMHDVSITDGPTATNTSIAKSNIISLFDKLSAKFNIPYKVDYDSEYPAYFKDGVVYMNPNKVEPDTPFHEFSHPFVMAMKKDNRALYDNLLEEASKATYKGESIEQFVRDKYKGEREVMIEEEIIVTALGLYAAEFMAVSHNKGLIAAIKLVWDYITAQVKEMFGNSDMSIKVSDISPESTLRDLAIMLNLDNTIVLRELGDMQQEQRESLSSERFIDPNQIQYTLKAVNILLSDKAKQVFDKGKKNGWSLDKILTELAIPKEQKQLLLDLGVTNREELAIELVSRYSYSVEINVSTTLETADMYGFTETGTPSSGRRAVPTQHYINLTAPGGTNYTENAISTPLIKHRVADVYEDHDQEFNAGQGTMLGWFRSDDKAINQVTYGSLADSGFSVGAYTYYKKNDKYYKSLTAADIPEVTELSKEQYEKEFKNRDDLKGELKSDSKIRRVLEVQSGFQKVREEEDLADNTEIDTEMVEHPMLGRVTLHKFAVNEKEYSSQLENVYYPDENQFEPEIRYYKDGLRITNKQFLEALNRVGNPTHSVGNPTHSVDFMIMEEAKKSNSFLQLLNKDNNWVTFFIKSIIQDSAKKGYEKVLFPKGETAAKIEGHTTISDEIEKRNNSINSYKREIERIKNNEELQEVGKHYLWSEVTTDDKPSIEKFNALIEVAEEEKKNLKSQGIEKLKPIEAFYEKVVTNILAKNYKDRIIDYTDEYGNKWSELTIDHVKDTQDILLQRESMVSGDTMAELNESYELHRREYAKREAETVRRQVASMMSGDEVKGKIKEAAVGVTKDKASHTYKTIRGEELIDVHTAMSFVGLGFAGEANWEFNANAGTFVHQIASAMLGVPVEGSEAIQGFEITDEAKVQLESILRGHNLMSPAYDIMSEVLLVDKSLGVAGTTDIIMRAKSGSRAYFIDLKTKIQRDEDKNPWRWYKSSQFANNDYNRNSTQLSAYQTLYESIVGEPVTNDDARLVMPLTLQLEGNVITGVTNDKSEYTSSTGLIGHNMNPSATKMFDVIREQGFDKKQAVRVKKAYDDVRVNLFSKVKVLRSKSKSKAEDEDTRELNNLLEQIEKLNALEGVMLFIEDANKRIGEMVGELQRMIHSEGIPNEQKINILNKAKEIIDSYDILNEIQMVISSKANEGAYTKQEYDADRADLRAKLGEKLITKEEYSQALLMLDDKLESNKDHYADVKSAIANMQAATNLYNEHSPFIYAEWLWGYMQVTNPEIEAVNQKIEDTIEHFRKYNRADFAKYHHQYNDLKKMQDKLSKVEYNARKLELSTKYLESKKLSRTSLEAALRESSKDVSWGEMMFYYAGGSSDNVIQMFAKVMKTELEKQREGMLNDEWEFGEAFEMLRNASPENRDRVDKFFDFMIEEVIVDDKYNYDKQEHDTHKELKIVDIVHWGNFNKARRDFYKQLYNKYMGIKPEYGTKEWKEWKQEENAWYSANTKPVDNVKEIIDQNKAWRGPESFDKWYNSNVAKDARGKVIGYMRDLARPNYEDIPAYKNKKFEAIEKNPELMKFYNFIVEKYTGYQNKLPLSQRPGLRLPSVRKEVRDLAAERGVIPALKDWKERTFKLQATDQSYGIEALGGGEARTIPVFYVNKIDTDLISRDVLSSIMLFGKMALQYEAKNNMVGKAQMLESIFETRDTLKTSGSNTNIVNAVARQVNVKRFLKEKDQKATNSLVMLRDFIDNVIYDRSEIVSNWGNINLNKLTDQMMAITSNLALPGNLIQAISNVSIGQAMNYLEGAGGQFYSQADYKNAVTDYWTHLHKMTGDLGKLHGTSLETQLVDLFDAQPGKYEEKYGRNISGGIAKKLAGKNLHYGLQEGGEFFMNYTIMAAILNKEKVMLNGEVVPLRNAYELNERGKLKLKDGVTKLDGSKFTNLDRIKITERIHNRAHQTQGVYDKFSRAGGKKYWIVKLAMMFRAWIPTGVNKRFGGYRFDVEGMDVTEGNYTNFRRIFLNDLMNKRFDVLYNWERYTPEEKQNLRRTLAEMGIFLAAVMLFTMLRPGDDDDESWARNMGAYAARRLMADLSFFIHPGETWNILKTPTATMGLITKLYKFGDQVMPWNISEEYEKKTGRYSKGTNKAWARAIDLIPIISQINKARSPEETLKFFILGNFK